MTAASADPAKSVLIVDDSRTIRALLRSLIEADGRLRVVGEAGDPYEARDLIKALNPDVLTLDIEMPRMSGMEFLVKLMSLRPMPVVMVSSRTKENSDEAVRALSIGAVDSVDVARVQADPDQRHKLTEAIFHAAHAQVQKHDPPSAACKAMAANFQWNGRMVLIGSSTGGVEALERILSIMPPNGPPILIAQHMPKAFLHSFAARLNRKIQPHVAIATDGIRVRRGQILLAPGGDHHLGVAEADRQQVRLIPSVADDLYVPSVEHLFSSAVTHASHVLGVMLTGMGSDGAQALRALRDNGAATLAQSHETCVVAGMPRAAEACGAVQETVRLSAMGRTILAHCSKETSL